MTKSRIAIFASGSGTNAEEIFKYFQHHSSIEVAILLTNNPDAYALSRAKRFGIPTKIFDKTTFKHGSEILNWLNQVKVTHIVLAGFLWLIPEYLIKDFPHRIINIHPALLPKYGGKGMYGMRVHHAVKASGDRETGITIHLVDENYDEGDIVFQAKCAVDSNDDANSIANKVHQLEHSAYPSVIDKWISKGLRSDPISSID